MSNFNKVVTNLQQSLSNAENDNLSQTLSAVRTAGGGGGGTSYGGDGIYIEIVGNNTITLTTTAAEKLNRAIPTTVAELTDSGDYATKDFADAKYQTKEAMSDYAKKTEIPDSISAFDDTESVIYSYINPATADIQQQINGKQNKLQFDLNAKGEISAIGPLNNTTALAGANGITGDYYSASNPSGFINSTQAETQILEKHYLTEASGNSLYVPIPNGLSDGQYYAMTTSSWKVIQGAGDVSGISTVAHDDTLTGNGNNENLGVDITKIQTKLTDAQIQNITDVTTLKTASAGWDKVSDKLDTTDFTTYTATTAPSTYQPLGNYLSSNALEGYATQQWVGQQGYIKQETDWTNTIQEASAKAYNDATANANSLYQAKGDYVKNTDISLDANNKITAISGKELIITAHQSLTDYYTKSQTSGANELSTEFGKYALKSEIPTVPTKVSDLTDSANYYKTTETSGAVEISTALDKKVDKPDTTQVELNNKYLIYSTLSAEGQPKGWVDMQTKVYSKTEADGTFQKKTDMGGYLTTEQYANDSATFYPTSNPDGYLTKTVADTYYQPTGYYATSAGLTAGNQYAMTTTGWAKIQGGGGSTVTIDTTNNEIKDGTSAVSAMSYVVNPNNAYWKPQRSCVCTEAEISTMAGYANGQGMLFFVVSGHNQ